MVDCKVADSSLCIHLEVLRRHDLEVNSVLRSSHDPQWTDKLDEMVSYLASSDAGLASSAGYEMGVQDSSAAEEGACQSVHVFVGGLQNCWHFQELVGRMPSSSILAMSAITAMNLQVSIYLLEAPLHPVRNGELDRLCHRHRRVVHSSFGLPLLLVRQ